MTLNRPVPVVLGLSALYGATFVVVRSLCVHSCPPPCPQPPYAEEHGRAFSGAQPAQLW